MAPIKIHILTAFHQRPRISQIYWMGIARLKKKFNIKTHAIISDEENHLLARQNECDYITLADNEPLGRKMNTGLAAAMQYDFDYLMQLGSDNLISSRSIEKSIDTMLAGMPFFGHNSIYFFDSETGQAKEKFYGNIIGAGRCISKSLIEKTLQKYTLWEDLRPRTLDMNSEARIEEAMRLAPAALQFDSPQIIDIKSKENIWPYDYFKDCTPADPASLKTLISETEYNAMISL